MATIETTPQNDKLDDFGLKQFIKAFSKLVYITLYGLKIAPHDVKESKGDMDMGKSKN